MRGSAQPETPVPAEKAGESTTPAGPAGSNGNSNGGQSLGEQELEAALQLLVERAQYITGATGAALALPSGHEMVCRASAGTSAPPVGARLQVRSGLTGESIARQQLLRCDNAELDPRVNLETCRQMGIASIVVMPLLRPNGEIRGLFELFSDHAYAFEERDLSALERMADLTLTALDLAEAGPGALAGFVGAGVGDQSVAPTEPRAETGEAPAAIAAVEEAGVEQEIGPKKDQKPDQRPDQRPGQVPIGETVETATVPLGKPMGYESMAADLMEGPSATEQAAPVPEAMRRVRKCVACGFPVSEGRSYCLDCEKKEGKRSAAPEPAAVESVPSFLDVPAPPDESWLGNHVNLLAIVVLLLGILVAIVVFR
ncbi:MAG: GAF domain-containing protein [Acidobacteriia bacterium]|nr:GAF domain-containing protein [Terriglobia bacterium]